MTPSLGNLLREKRVIVSCGAGGVGKTTVSASLALAAARRGLRVVVITIDPSRRLAEALGVVRNQRAPTALPADRLRAVGVEPPGSLAAWMLDPQAVCENVVRRTSPDPEAASRMLDNRVYQHVSALIAGMQEYAAVEALHGFIRDDSYDLVVLDTPPSRNALRFLEAPARATSFLDPRVLQLFLPSRNNFVVRAGAKLVSTVLKMGLGRNSFEEIQTFLVLFESIFRHLNRNQAEMRQFFASAACSFLLVTSPERAALEEAFYFEDKTRTLGLPLGGYILNRSVSWFSDLPDPRAVELAADATLAERGALAHLTVLAQAETAAAAQHHAVAQRLRDRMGQAGRVWELPWLEQDLADLPALVGLAERLAA